MSAGPEDTAVLLRPCLDMFGCYGVGFIFYISRFPERLSPQWFRHVGSHLMYSSTSVWIVTK